MIKLVTPDMEDTLLHTCGKDPAGMRVRGLFLSYGLKYTFCEYWVQSDGQGTSAGIARLDGNVTVCGTPTDAPELSAFLQAIGCTDIFAVRETGEMLCFPVHNEGIIMQLPQSVNTDVDLDCDPPLKDIYTILACGGEAISLGEHDVWYADVSHRIRHGTAKAVLLRQNDKPAACAMVLAQDDTTALLGGIAVLPEHRGKGLGCKVVAGLCSILQKEQKEIILCCCGNVRDFYQKLGFRVTGGWVLLDGNKYR